MLSGTPESVLDQALLYIFIYFLSIPFMLVYNFGSAVLRSYGDSRRPMYYLLISGTVNVILNLFLVIALQLGVAGVAIATVISNVLSAGMVLTHLARRNDDFAFRFRRMRIEKMPLLRILQIGIPAGIQGAMKSGILAGYNVVDVRVELYDGSYHEVDSSEMAFKIAGSMAFKDAAKRANPIILEPMMKVTVIVPEEYMGDVIGDLNSRRGQIQGMEDRAGAKQINARVPLSEMFGYVNDLLSLIHI